MRNELQFPFALHYVAEYKNDYVNKVDEEKTRKFILTFQIESINNNNNNNKGFWDAISRKTLIFLPNPKPAFMCSQVDYHPSKFQLKYRGNEREITF